MKSKSFFFRLFVSYILIIIAAVGVICIQLYRNSISELQADLERISLNYTKLACAKVDQRIEECNNIAAQISINADLTYSSMVKNNCRAIEGINELKKYLSGNTYLNDIVMYYRDAPGLYSSMGMATVDITLNNRYKLSKEEKQKFTAMLDSNQEELMDFPSCGLIAYTIPQSLRDGRVFSKIVFIFKAKDLCNLLLEGRPMENNAVFLMDKKQNILFAYTSDEPYGYPEFITALKENNMAGMYNFNCRNVKYTRFVAESEKSGWKCVYAAPTSFLFRQVFSQKIIVMAYILIILIGCISLAYFLAHRNYHPIKKLKQSLGPVQDQGGNELESISQVIHQVMSQNHSLLQQYGEQQLLIKHRFLIGLLKGEIVKEDVEHSKVRFDIELKGPYYTVISIRTIEAPLEKPPVNEKLLDYINLEFSKSGLAYGVETEDGNIALTVNLPSLDNSQTLQNISALLIQFYTAIGNRVQIGIGKTYADIGDLSRAYVQSKSAAEYVNSGSTVVFFSDTAIPVVDYQLTKDSQVLLLHSIKQGNEESALQILNEVFTDIQNKQQPLIYVKFYFYRLVNTIIDFSKQLAANQEWIDDTKEFNDLLAELSDLSSAETLKNPITEWICKICGCILQQNQDSEQKLKDSLLAYVQEYCCNPNLSLESVSQKFGYSSYYWSRFFKDRIGFLFSDYLWKLRGEKAKKLLVTTPLPIKEIVCRIGYYDTTSFIRRFKAEEGITPGQYRKMFDMAIKDSVDNGK